MSSSNGVTIGKVIRPHGVRGEVKVLPLTDFPERFSLLDKVHLELEDGTICEVSVERARNHGRFLILKFGEIDTASQAQALRNSFLVIQRDQTVPLPAGTFYIFDIIGMEVQTECGEQIGHITDVLHFPANDVYVVKTAEKEVLIPATREVVRDIDMPAKCMKIRLLDGLLE